MKRDIDHPVPLVTAHANQWRIMMDARIVDNDLNGCRLYQGLKGLS